MFRYYSFVVGFFLFILIGGCTKKETDHTKSISELQEENGYPVRIQRAAVDDLIRIDRQGGVVKGVYQTTVRVGVSGKITSIPVHTGSRIGRNGVIATIDPDGASPYILAKTEYDNTKKSLERIEALKDEGGVSQDVLDQVKARYEVAKENLHAARHSVTVVAPFSGVVLDIMEEKNSKVGPGTAVAKLARVDELKVELFVNEASIHEYTEGQDAFTIIKRDTVWGEVTRVGAGANELTHAFPVTVSFRNDDEFLKPGMFVSVYVITARKKALVLPVDIIQMNGDSTYVYSVNEGMASRVSVALGIRGDGGFEITQGIKEGDLVVMQGAGLLRDGVRIRIVD
ncbi:MAG: efflux RND transporter periplasmic adaptor subunit [Fibrobacterota bacterium]